MYTIFNVAAKMADKNKESASQSSTEDKDSTEKSDSNQETKTSESSKEAENVANKLSELSVKESVKSNTDCDKTVESKGTADGDKEK